jgi:uncharacterized protein (TIGR03437 family)
LHIQPFVHMKLKSIALLLPLAAGWHAAAQSWDTSGNGLLNGTYYFRQVIWSIGDSSGDIGEAISLYGTISFNGSGSYTVSNVQVFDSSVGTICTIGQANTTCSSYPTSGTYSIAASGYGFIQSLVTSDNEYGLVSKGIWVGSATENSSCQAGDNPCYNDLFIAVPVPSTPFSNSAFQGSYTMASLDFTGAGEEGGLIYTRGSTFQMTPDGNGNVPGFTATGYITTNGSAETSQNVPSAQYSFSNSAAVYNLAGSISTANVSTVLLAGQKYLYLSPDGNFVFGGSPTGWDMIVGVRTSSGGTPNFSGLYYQIGAAVDNYELSADGYSDIETFYGSYNTGNFISGTGADIVAHQRVDDGLEAYEGEGYASDYTYLDFVTSTNGVYSDSYNQYAFSDGGAVAIGFPTIISSGAELGVTVMLQSPSFSGSGVYINPTAVVNAGSVAPFTAQFAPGELISIFGTNLASTTAQDLSLITPLGNVQVMINGESALLSFVSPTQINAVVPIDITTSIASVQVINNGVSSNTVTNFVGETQPGVFNSISTLPAFEHADYSMVTSSSPAQPGETILVYLTGLGTLSGGNATSSIAAYFEDPVNGLLTATVDYAGSPSTVGGGYQMNITLPSTISSGNLFLDIAGPDSYNSAAIVPVGTGTASLRKHVRLPHNRKRSKPKFQRGPAEGAEPRTSQMRKALE